jgi:uncharacterized protein
MDLIQLEPWQWALALAGAFFIGFSKTGVTGIGILAIAIFANVLPTKQSVGVVLPLLICADIVAVLSYRRHAQWSYLWKLIPWTSAGVVIGFLVMGRIGDAEVGVITGCILVSLIAIHLGRNWLQWKRDGQPAPVPKHFAFAMTMGIAAGFTTMISNAAGPIMILYLLAMRLPKMEFMGTGAIYFLLMNSFKVPFGVSLGIISSESFFLNMKLFPAVVAGALLGRLLLRFIPQKLFERLAFAFTFVAAIRLVVVSL